VGAADDFSIGECAERADCSSTGYAGKGTKNLIGKHKANDAFCGNKFRLGEIKLKEYTRAVAKYSVLCCRNG